MTGSSRTTKSAHSLLPTSIMLWLLIVSHRPASAPDRNCKTANMLKPFAVSLRGRALLDSTRFNRGPSRKPADPAPGCCARQ